jgi:hypothetical protein
VVKVIRNIHRLILIVVVLSAPAIMTSLLVRYYFNTTLRDFIPGAINDEVDYWYETLTFTKVGFNGGYQTFEEHPALAKFFHFEAHGPMFPMLFGTVGRFVGWHTYSGPIFNAVLIALALCIFIFIAKLDSRQLMLVGLATLTFWPLLLYLPTNMQESLHQAIAIIFAGIFYVLISGIEQSSIKFNALSLSFILFASLIRPTWSFLLIPFFILILRDKSKSRLALAFLKAIFLIILSFFISFYWSAPYPNEFVRRLLNALSISFPKGIQFFILHAVANSKGWISIYNGAPLEVLQRYQISFLFIICSVSVFFFWKHGIKKAGQIIDPAVLNENLFHIFNLGAISLAVILFYRPLDFQDYRVCAPYLLITILLLIALKKRFWLVGLIILSNLLFMPALHRTYKENLSGNFVYDRQSIVLFHQAIKDLIAYKENSNPWCNTLLSFISPDSLPYQFIGLPPGFGISYIYKLDRLRFPIKSKYILLDEKGYNLLNGKVNMKLLGATSLGNLFVNSDSGCI